MENTLITNKIIIETTKNFVEKYFIVDPLIEVYGVISPINDQKILFLRCKMQFLKEALKEQKVEKGK